MLRARASCALTVVLLSVAALDAQAPRPASAAGVCEAGAGGSCNSTSGGSADASFKQWTGHDALAGQQDRRSALLLAAQLAGAGHVFRRAGVIDEGNWLVEALLWACAGNSSRCQVKNIYWRGCGWLR